MASEINNFVGDGFLEYLYVLDSRYQKKLIIDTFSDFLWVERYSGYGEFEITVPITLEIVQNCRLKDYVSIRESDKIMIVETIIVHSDPVNGDSLVISGRSLESLLDRRVMIQESIPGTNVQDSIISMITQNVSSPTDSRRRIPNFSIRRSFDSRVTGLTLEAPIENEGGNIYEEIESICKDKDLGFRVEGNGAGGFVFELYFGTDRTWDQKGTQPVVFSESYDNLVNSDYMQSEKDYRSNVYVKSSYEHKWTEQIVDEEGNVSYLEHTETRYRLDEVYRKSQRIGLDRRETYMNGGEFVSISDVAKQGKEFLADYKVTKLFEGETMPFRQFVYGTDYVLGDVVQLQNKYGQTGKCRITEIVRSRDASGPSMTPTFTAIEDDDD